MAAPRLQGWLKDRSDFVEWRARDLAPYLDRWIDEACDPEFLLPKPLLMTARNWLREYPDVLAGPASDYIEASERRWVEEQRLLEEARQIRERKEESERKRHLRDVDLGGRLAEQAER